MGKGANMNPSLWSDVKDLIGRLAFKIMLWTMNKTRDEYLKDIYEQERIYHETHD
jgi:hypothetical protein